MIGALCFLTVIGRGRPPQPRQQWWFPVVGAGLGGVLGLLWWGALQWWPPLVAAALVVVADVVLTGMLHLDGLADTADGLLAPMDRERRLAVMKTPDIGAFALATVSATVLLRWAALAGIRLDGARTTAALAGVWALSRGLMVVAMTAQRPARPGGLGALFGGDEPRAGRALALAVVTLAVALPLLAAGRGTVPALVVAAAATAAAGAVLALARRRLGGWTGDVLGAAGVLAETVALLALTARP